MATAPQLVDALSAEYISVVPAKKAAGMNSAPMFQDWQASRIDEWLLAILRFSITLKGADEARVRALADEMDRLGAVPGRPAFDFFERTSIDLCHAIAAKDDPNRMPILRRHLARIQEPRMKRAFMAALGLDRQPYATAYERRHKLKQPLGGRSN